MGNVPAEDFTMATKQSKTDKLLDAHYATLKEFELQYALHEGAVSIAFQTLLAETGRPHHWTLIPQLSDKKTGKSIRPDGGKRVSGTLKSPKSVRHASPLSRKHDGQVSRLESRK
jgi:hypothetical protein